MTEEQRNAETLEAIETLVDRLGAMLDASHTDHALRYDPASMKAKALCNALSAYPSIVGQKVLAALRNGKIE